MEADFRNEFVRHPTSTKNNPALVLNADYRPLSYYPLSLWCWQDAVKAAFMERVDIVAEYDDYVNSPSISIKIPSVVVLKDYVRPQKKVAFTRFNLFLRDEFSCQYCGSKGDLTFDHVVPRSQGGTTNWANVVAACSPCNLKKANKMPAKCNMHPLKKPAAPTVWQLQENGRAYPPNYCLLYTSPSPRDQRGSGMPACG